MRKNDTVNKLVMGFRVIFDMLTIRPLHKGSLTQYGKIMVTKSR